MNVVTALAVFLVVFPAELPDKTMIASLVLGTRYRALFVWVGVAAAFTIHVMLAVAAGTVFTLLPHRLVDAVVAVLFAAGAVILLVVPVETEAVEGEAEAEAGVSLVSAVGPPRFWTVAGASFAVVFIAEWGDLTQIATANLAARYHDPVSVAIGATVALWSVAALAVLAGDRLLARVPLTVVRRITAGVLCVFAVISAVEAIWG